MSANLTDQAIELLVTRRWPMLPSTGAQKKPCVRWKGFQEQLPTVDQLHQWGRKFNPDRWGLVTGRLAGIVVVDFDGDAGRALMQKWGISPHVRTGSGGCHWYVQHPGWRVPTLNAKTGKRSWPWPGLDIRGDGGFAVLLGRNKNGSYEQLRELVPDPFDALPEAVRTYLCNHGENETAPPQPVRSHPRKTGGGDWVDSEILIRKALEMAPSSGRNNAGIWLACQLRDNGYSIDDAEVPMRDYRSRVPSTNAQGQREPYSVVEMMSSLRQAYSRPAREPWAQGRQRPHDGTYPAAVPSEEKGRRDDDAPSRENAPHVGDADGSESIGIYVGYTGNPQVGYTGIPLSRKSYARVPREVYADSRLEARDIRIYCVLAAGCWQGSVANIGKRRIAKEARCAECKVSESLKRLETAGHIQRQPGQIRGQRARYVLLSLVFGQKQRAGVDEVALGPNGPRLVSVRKEQGTASTLTSFPKRQKDQKKSYSGTGHSA